MVFVETTNGTVRMLNEQLDNEYARIRAEEREAQAAEEANERAQARYERGIYGE